MGASDEQIAHLGMVYAFTMEFGVYIEENRKVAFGAGIAGSMAEMKHFLGKDAKFQIFNPFVDCK